MRADKEFCRDSKLELEKEAQQMESCEARHEQDRGLSEHIASGLRSEYSNHS